MKKFVPHICPYSSMVEQLSCKQSMAVRFDLWARLTMLQKCSIVDSLLENYTVFLRL